MPGGFGGGGGGGGVAYDGSASDGIIFSSSASQTGIYTHVLTASSSIILSSSNGSAVARNRPVFARDAVALSSSAGFAASRVFRLSARDVLTLSGPTQPHTDLIALHAHDSIRINSGASIPPALIYNRSAVDTFNVAGQTFKNSTKIVSALDSFQVSSSAVDTMATSSPQTYHLSASDSLRFSSGWLFSGPFAFKLHARDTIKVSSSASGSAIRHYKLSAIDTMGFAGSASASQIRTISVAASDRIAISSAATKGTEKLYGLRAADTINLAGSPTATFSKRASASDSLIVSGSATGKVARLLAASDHVRFSDSLASYRAYARASADAIHFAGTARSNRFFALAATSSFNFSSQVAASVIRHGGSSSFRLFDSASVSILLASGGTIPGGDANSGLQVVSYASVSGRFPMSFAETLDGLLLIADGVDPMLRWDGLSGMADTAGVLPPASPIALAASGPGTGLIMGYRQAFCRFIDSAGNPSNPSPMSGVVDCGYDAQIEGLACDPNSGLVTILSHGHGLKSGYGIIVQDVDGPPINGPKTVVVLDLDHFTLGTVPVTSNTWTGTGSWSRGSASILYQNVPVPAESKVARRQILRNLDGVADVFYVDIDTTDLIATTFSSALLDEELATGEGVPLLSGDDTPIAMRYGVPPSNKAILASYMGRIFAAGEVSITDGNAAPTLGSKIVRGIGTDWLPSFAGRFLYVSGASRPYEIASVDRANQAITLTTPYLDSSKPYAAYAIRSAPAERKLLYYSEASLPEAWPPWNSVAIPEDNDEITGLLAKSSFLYVIEKRHIYRFTQQDDPAEGMAFLSVSRGCVNGRSFVVADDTVYLLDESGIYAFDGDQSVKAISMPIQTLFHMDGAIGGLSVDWGADRTLWHATLDAVRDTIRWFVSMVGTGGIYHAICYDYRRDHWWIEEFPTEITASTTGTIGYRRSLVGTDARRLLCLSEGSLDVVADSPALGGLVTSADPTSLTDSLASFPAKLDGVPVSITNGTGRGQQAMIVANTSDTLTILDPWAITPDATSTYQVGGVNWSWQSGWFSLLIADEDNNPRDVAITHQPTQHPATLDIRLLFDHSTDPQSWGYTVNQDGISVSDGDPNLTVSLQSRPLRSGWASQRFASNSEIYGYGPQFLSLQMSGVQGSESIRVFQIDISGSQAGDQ